MSEMCCTRLDAENIHNAKNCQKIRNLGTIAQLYRAVSLHVSTIGRKTCSAAISPPHVPRIWRTSAHWWLRSVYQFGAPVSRLAFVTVATSLTGGQPNFARSLAVSWAGTLYIHFWGLLIASWRNFARCKIHFTSKSCVLLGLY